MPADQPPGILGQPERELSDVGEALLADPPEGLHALENVVAPKPRNLRIVDRLVVVRLSDQACEQGSLGQGELACGLPEVELRRRPDAVDAVAHVDLVEVELEDVLFPVLLLDADRQGELLDLALDALAEL